MRRQPAEIQESSIGHEADTKANESGAQQASALPLDPTEAAHTPNYDENSPIDLVAATGANETDSDLDVLPPVEEEIQASARHALSRSPTEVHAVAPENEKGKKLYQNCGRTAWTREENPRRHRCAKLCRCK
ncbi:hypothetical protein AJ87_11065 [Rhizobium yanglingense]|nr:hypothetical protein AJ87_11065 [Rhizobium yanglingense]